jgi:hypothetical protein
MLDRRLVAPAHQQAYCNNSNRDYKGDQPCDAQVSAELPRFRSSLLQILFSFKHYCPRSTARRRR